MHGSSTPFILSYRKLTVLLTAMWWYWCRLGHSMEWNEHSHSCENGKFMSLVLSLSYLIVVCYWNLY